LKKRFLSILLLLAVLLNAPALAQDSYGLGDAMPDFTFTAYDGREITLSDVLAEKELVLINLWASWCGPCRYEFPFMQEAYEAYSDRVEILALSIEPTDSDEVISALAEELGLTFPMGQDAANLAQAFYVSSIPTTIVVDRYGTICMIEMGAQDSAEKFARIFEAFLGDGYAESVTYDGIPPELPAAPAFSEEELSAALNGEGGSIVFRNPDDAYNWHMAVTDADGRSAVVSTNGGKPDSSSAIAFTVSVEERDALAFDYRISSDYCFDYLRLYVNGELVKRFSGEREWATYVHAFASAGEYEIEIAYTKDRSDDMGEDALWLDNVRLLTGDDALAAMEAMPAYPVYGETELRVAGDGVRTVVLEDPYGALLSTFGSVPAAYVVNDSAAEVEFLPGAGVDPDAAVAMDAMRDGYFSLADLYGEGGYRMQVALNELETTGECWTAAMLYPDVDVPEMAAVLLFADEENLVYFMENYVGGAWAYADGAEKYVIRVEDQNGDPVPGVLLQVCDDVSCMVYTTDESGAAELDVAPGEYEVHVLQAPDGYSAAEDVSYVTSAEPSELHIEVIKE